MKKKVIKELFTGEKYYVEDNKAHILLESGGEYTVDLPMTYISTSDYVIFPDDHNENIGDHIEKSGFWIPISKLQEILNNTTYDMGEWFWFEGMKRGRLDHSTNKLVPNHIDGV